MTKKLTPWEKNRRLIIRRILSKKIKHDNRIVLADFDGLIFLVRPDLIPMGFWCCWDELDFYEDPK